jgi:hypothetical protein
MGPYLCNPAYTPPHTHIVCGVDVRAGRQQDLRHLRMLICCRPVKWGGHVLRGGKSGKVDTQRDKTTLM